MYLFSMKIMQRKTSNRNKKLQQFSFSTEPQFWRRQIDVSKIREKMKEIQTKALLCLLLFHPYCCVSVVLCLRLFFHTIYGNQAIFRIQSSTIWVWRSAFCAYRTFVRESHTQKKYNSKKPCVSFSVCDAVSFFFSHCTSKLLCMRSWFNDDD